MTKEELRAEVQRKEAEIEELQKELVSLGVPKLKDVVGKCVAVRNAHGEICECLFDATKYRAVGENNGFIVISGGSCVDINLRDASISWTFTGGNITYRPELEDIEIMSRESMLELLGKTMKDLFV